MAHLYDESGGACRLDVVIIWLTRCPGNHSAHHPLHSLRPHCRFQHAVPPGHHLQRGPSLLLQVTRDCDCGGTTSLIAMLQVVLGTAEHELHCGAVHLPGVLDSAPPLRGEVPHAWRGIRSVPKLLPARV